MNCVEYDGALHGAVSYPEGFEKMLDGLEVEEQLEYFRIGNGLYRKKPVLQRRKLPRDYSSRLENQEEVEALILQNGRIAGVMVKNCHGKVVPCMPEQGYIIRDDEEEDGSGYKEYKLYNYLICVPKSFDED